MPTSLNDQPLDYDRAIADVEAIVDQIESGVLPLEELFAHFTIAVEQLHACERYLARGREQMELLVETLDDSPEDGASKPEAHALEELDF
ncbi:exonuclease VII small subunit [Rubidibacter lacunae KORDI 51-2]|uniref:Exodeoxyribonuclease 7 small subunit n=1 Tax=Rubidibacter lacunae KORDI 51-2 TaxID=582515 RepID=U5DMR3_9CHRO|nr:exodeoxyribonuclease VII small subunit [Rubidibacter lacunae]ERN41904.1 exonuclease VII small subunit [Rubidibacter lacunae KORDI 51-2]